MTQENNDPLSLSSAAVVESSLLAFGAGMSAQNRQDAKNSYLFATLVANKQHDQLTLSESWFETFIAAMGDCGWTVARRTYEKESDTGQSLKLANVAVKAVQMAASSVLQGTPAAQMLSVLAEKAIDGLGKDEQALTLFKRNLYSKSNVVVGVASCIESAEGEVVMALGAIQRSVRREDVDVLVFDWDSSSSTTYRSTVALSFNAQIYARARDIVEQRLGDRVASRIMDYEI